MVRVVHLENMKRQREERCYRSRQIETTEHTHTNSTCRLYACKNHVERISKQSERVINEQDVHVLTSVRTNIICQEFCCDCVVFLIVFLMAKEPLLVIPLTACVTLFIVWCVLYLLTF